MDTIRSWVIRERALGIPDIAIAAQLGITTAQLQKLIAPPAATGSSAGLVILFFVLAYALSR